MQMEEFSFSEVVDILKRNSKSIYRWIIGITIAGVLVAYLYPPTYEASSKVIVKRAGQNISLSDQAYDPNNVRVTMEDQINTEMEIIRSRPVLERVAERLELQPGKTAEATSSFIRTAKEKVTQAFGAVLRSLDLRPEVSAVDALCIELNDNLTLNPILDSSVIEIIASADSPEIAAARANLITEEYMKWHLEVYRGKGASQFYNEQLVETKAKLERLEDELASYKEKEGLVSIEETKANLLEQLSLLNTSFSELEKEIISEESNLRIIKAQVKADGDRLIPTLEIGEIPWIQEARNNLMELELKRNELEQKYTMTHRELLNLEGEIKLTRDFIRSEVQKVIELKEVGLRGLKTERSALKKVIDDIQARINELPKKELIIRRYERAIDETKEIFGSLSLKMEESNITESSDERVVNIKLISKAHPPPAPAFPNKILTIFISPFLGMICGITLAIIKELGSRRLTEEKEGGEGVGVPVASDLTEQRS